MLLALEDFFDDLGQRVAYEFLDDLWGILLYKSVKRGVNCHKCAALVKQWMEQAVGQSVDLAFGVVPLFLLSRSVMSQFFTSKKGGIVGRG